MVVDHVRNQLSTSGETVANESNITTTHSPVFSLDMAPGNPTNGGCLECSACRIAFLFCDTLRHVSMVKVDGDPTWLAEVADSVSAAHIHLWPM